MRKTRVIRILSVVLSLLIVIGITTISRETVMAATDATTGITYTITGGSATITDFVAPTGFSGALTIPATLGGASVTSIGDYAFYNSFTLTSITIPSSVTSIGERVFYFSMNLISITVDTANTTYKSVDGILFSKDGTLLICCPAAKSGSITIPSSVTSVGAYAFDYCTSLTGITIPSSVTSIGEYAFFACTRLAIVTIPSSVTIIGSFAFSSCGSLTAITVDPANTVYKSLDGLMLSKDGTELICCPEGKSGSITIPSSVTRILDNAVSGCRSLTGVTIPSSVTSIGIRAFYGCSILTGITIPSGVTSIGEEALYYCTKLTSITVDAGNLAYKSVDGLLLSKDGTGFVFCPEGKSGSITIPRGVTSIEDGAFYVCRSLSSITIPNGVTSIGADAFAYCSSLTNITIPSGVTSIGNYAFWGCPGLTSITIPSSITSLGRGAFEFCGNLSDAYFYGNAPAMGGLVFSRNAADFTVHYLSTSTGYTNLWYGYNTVPFSAASVSYQTHVQDIGWQDYVSDGAVSGTSAQSKRLEEIRIKLDLEGISGGIEYKTQVQDIGWMDWVADDAMSGTSGQSKRLEAIQIRLTGEAANVYDVYYRVHAQNTGWMDWAKNGASAGTAGYSYRLEAIEVKLVLKGGAAPGPTANPFIDLYELDTVSYKTHVQDVGWQEYVSNGEVSGTSAQSKRLEAIQIKLENMAGGIEYRTHVQDYGWMDWVANDALSGTSGLSKRLEAIQIRLTGAAAEAYDIYYCVHAQNTGWLDWAKNGESAGTAGFSYRLEAIKVVLVPKGGAAPGATTRAFVQG